MADRTESSQNIQEVSVLYRTPDYIVVDKGYDVLINSDDTSHRNTVEHQLRKQFPDLVDGSVQHGFRFQHRLDHATSGVMCVCLNKKFSGTFCKLLEKRLVTKHYLALVRGLVHPPDDDTMVRNIEVPLGRDSSVTDHCKMCTADDPNCGNILSASTGVVVLEHGTYDGMAVSKLLLIPKTGRTHQLRVHCKHIGHTIVGDYTYSYRSDTKPDRMMLHAYHLVVPLVPESLDITAPDPFTTEKDQLWIANKVFVTYEDFVRSSCSESKACGSGLQKDKTRTRDSNSGQNSNELL